MHGSCEGHLPIFLDIALELRPANHSGPGKWQTKQGGIYVAASVGTAILGRGADEYLIDDPFGSMQDARSETIRNSVWEWYNGTVYNRLQPGGAIIIIGHRMHEDDLAGRLIERMKAGDGADQWTIVRLPAIAEEPTKEYPEPDPLGRKPGEALWPASYPIKSLDRIRANTQPPRNWFALYQQRPTPDEGAMFMPDKITVRKDMNTSDVVVWVRAWDLAASLDGDWTAGVLLGRTRSGKVVVGGVRRLRGRPEAVSEAIAAQARLDTVKVKIALPVDPGQAGLAQKEAFVKLLNGFRVDFSPESGDKETRAARFAVQVNNNNVEMIEDTWNAAYREELRSFPNGKYVQGCPRLSLLMLGGDLRKLGVEVGNRVDPGSLLSRDAEPLDQAVGPPFGPQNLVEITLAFAQVVASRGLGERQSLSSGLDPQLQHRADLDSGCGQCACEQAPQFGNPARGDGATVDLRQRLGARPRLSRARISGLSNGSCLASKHQPVTLIRTPADQTTASHGAKCLSNYCRYGPILS